MRKTILTCVGAALTLGAAAAIGYGVWGMAAGGSTSRPAEPADAASNADDRAEQPSTLEAPKAKPAQQRAAGADPLAAAGDAPLVGAPTPSETLRPPIAHGDTHDWRTCATSRYEGIVRDHIEHPAFYLPKPAVLGRRILVQWPTQVGVHVHLLSREAGEPPTYRSIDTIWASDESDRTELLTRVTPDVDVLLVVVPPAKYLFDAPDGTETEREVGPQLAAVRLGASPISALGARRAAGAAEMGGYLLLSPESANWFTATIYHGREISRATVELGGELLPSVFSIGVEHDDGTHTWMMAYPWPLQALLEPLMNETATLSMVDAAGRRSELSGPAPPKAQVSVLEPEVPTSQATMLVASSGRIGERYRMSFFMWPDPPEPPAEEERADGASGPAPNREAGDDTIVHEVWEFAPTKEEERIGIHEVKVEREGGGEAAAPMSMRMTPVWPE